MIVLAMDTSSAISVAIAVDGQVQASQHVYSPRAHAERLAPMVRDALAEAGIGINVVDLIAVGRGPGPFTGLRVGLVTARALGFAVGIPVHGVVSLDAIAARARRLGTGGRELIVATDARRREVYWARYDPAGRRLSGPAVNSPDHLDIDGAMVLGRGVRVYPHLSGAGDPLATPPHLMVSHADDLLDPHAADLAHLASAQVRAEHALVDPEPLYLRRPDATVPGAPKPVCT